MSQAAGKADMDNPLRCRCTFLKDFAGNSVLGIFHNRADTLQRIKRSLGECMKKRDFFQKYLKIGDEKILDELERHSWLWRAKRRDRIMEEGELLKDIPFLVSGILKACYRDSSGEENVYCFAYREGEVEASINSLHGEVRAISTVKAITECELCYVSLEVLQNLVRSVPELGYTYETLLSESMKNMVEYERIVNQCDSTMRYAWFAEKYPELTDRRISQKDIASYLHMSAEHLSRIRSGKKQ